MDRKFQIFCKNEEEPYYLISINKQKLVVHYDPLEAAGARWWPLGASWGPLGSTRPNSPASFLNGLKIPNILQK